MRLTMGKFILLAALTICAHACLASTSFNLFFNSGDFVLANQLFAREVLGNPKDVGLRLTYAISLLETGDTVEANKQISDALDLEPQAEIIRKLYSSVNQSGIAGGNIMGGSKTFGQPPMASRGGPDLSAPVLMAALASHPESAAIKKLLGDYYSLTGNPSKALQYYSSAAVAAPKWDKPLMGIALACIDSDTPKSINLLEDILSKNPANSKAQLWLGDAYLKSGLTKEALYSFSKAAKDPKLKSEASVRVGALFLRTNNARLAGKNFAQAAQADPLNAAAFVGQAQVYKFTQQQDLADQAVLQAHKVSIGASAATRSTVYYNDALTSKSYQLSIQNIDQAQALAPDIQAPYAERARIYLSQNKLAEENGRYAEALKVNSMDVSAMRYLVEGYDLANDQAKRLDMLDRLTGAEPGHSWNWKLKRAETLMKMGRKDDAVKQWVEVQHQGYPTLASSIIQSAMSVKGGIEALYSVIRNSDNRDCIHLKYAFMNDAGQFKSALDCLNTVIKLDPTNPTLYGQKGAVLERLGRQIEAEGSYRRQRELIPTPPEPPGPLAP